MRIQKKTVDRMIERAKKRWGIPDWDITWTYGNLGYDACIDPHYWSEKRAEITLDRTYVKNTTRKFLERVVTHEVGHCILYNLDRRLSDWLDHYGPKDDKARATFDESMNTVENDILDHLIVQVMGL